jgi:hypothetical protein
VSGDEFQEYNLGSKGGRGVEMTILPPSCADFVEIWERQPPGTFWAYTWFALIFTTANFLNASLNIP